MNKVERKVHIAGRVQVIKAALAEAGYPEGTAYIDAEGFVVIDKTVPFIIAWRAFQVAGTPTYQCFRCFEHQNEKSLILLMLDPPPACAADRLFMDDCGALG